MKIQDRGAWLVVLGACLGTTLIRLRLLAVPLERDEGEYAYIAQMLLQGEAPYGAVHDLKSPGIFVAYALIFLVAEQSHLAIHLALLWVNVATTLLVFLLGRKLLDATAGAAAAVSYAALSLSAGVLGFTTNAEPLVLLPVCGGLVLLLRARESEHLAWLAASGLALGAALTIKQNAAFFALFALLSLWFGDIHRRREWPTRALRAGALLAGIATPTLVLWAALLAAGVFAQFWFWTVEFPLQYVTTLTPQAGMARLFRELPKVVSGTWALWGLAAFGLFTTAFAPQLRGRRAFVLGLLLAACAALAPGFYFRSHYFLLLMPALSLLIGIGVRSAADFIKLGGTAFRRGLPAAVLALALLHFAYSESPYLFRLQPQEVSRAYYGTNPFPESLEIARYISDHTTPSDRVGILGSEPQIYFYAQRQSATPHILMYPLAGSDETSRRMQDELMRSIEEQKPRYLVYVNLDASWLDTSTLSDPRSRIDPWFDDYVRKHYVKVGLIDVFASTSDYYWDGEARSRRPNSSQWISVYRRPF